MLVTDVDAVIHLAGENRPATEAAFDTVNAGLTATLCEALRAKVAPTPLILASSTQATRDNAYGRSKKAGEEHVAALGAEGVHPVLTYRLPGVFGKWARPNYNSVVATFCHNVARGLPIRVDDPAATLRLVYVDDVADEWLARFDAGITGSAMVDVAPVYETTLGSLATTVRSFSEDRSMLTIGAVGTGFLRALYATYVSYLPHEAFAYDIPAHRDPRGAFVEMLKTPESGQFSFFTAHPGVTRGGHYHHTKTEKFLVIRGEARFSFRHMVTGERVELLTSDATPKIVETIPGWAHDITNIGEEEMIVMLWANEVFDRARPDTIAEAV
jgi:UDP-2-acetamido-2,6-beta-L-arabino-hexul-4-ose reductase